MHYTLRTDMSVEGPLCNGAIFISFRNRPTYSFPNALFANVHSSLNLIVTYNRYKLFCWKANRIDTDSIWLD